MKSYDIIVAGLGAMGSSAIYHAARRGLRVLGIEQFDQVPHDKASYHGSTRVIRKAYFEDPGYVPLLLQAYDLWERLEQETGHKILVKCGGLMIGAPESEVVSGAILAAKEHGLAYKELTRSEVLRHYPALTLDEGQVAVFEPEAGYLYSEVAVQAHVQQAVACGAEIRLGTKLGGWKADGSGVTVQLAGEVVHAEQLILTVGAWAPDFVPTIPLEVERQVLLWFQPRGVNLTNLPIYIVEEQDGTQFYGFPEIPSQGSKVALHHNGQIFTADTLDRTIHATDIERMRSALSRRVPSLASGELLNASACMYSNTPDLHFVVGRHPDHANVVLGLGYSGHGFKFSSVMGELLVDLAREDRGMEIPGIFAPNRRSLTM